MALVYDNTRSPKKGGGWVEWNGPLQGPGGWGDELIRRRQEASAAYQRSKNRWNTVGKIATAATAIPFAAAAPALFGGAAATTGGAAAATTAGAGKALTLGSILNHPLTSLGVNTVGSVLSARSQNKANQYQADKNAEGLAQQIALERERIENEKAEIAATRAEDQRRWNAEEAYRAKQAADAEEERQYMLARRRAYDPMRERALRTVGSILGF
jgi:hypothetical protein